MNVHEFKDSKKQLKRNLKNAESTLRDVLSTVQAVEKDRDKFAHIDDAQLYERKALVNTSKDRLIKAKEERRNELRRNQAQNFGGRAQQSDSAIW